MERERNTRERERERGVKKKIGDFYFYREKREFGSIMFWKLKARNLGAPQVRRIMGYGEE